MKNYKEQQVWRSPSRNCGMKGEKGGDTYRERWSKGKSVVVVPGFTCLFVFQSTIYSYFEKFNSINKFKFFKNPVVP